MAARSSSASWIAPDAGRASSLKESMHHIASGFSARVYPQGAPQGTDKGEVSSDTEQHENESKEKFDARQSSKEKYDARQPSQAAPSYRGKGYGPGYAQGP